jgi:hypothetical protein
MRADDWTLDGLAQETERAAAGWGAPYPVPYALPPNLRLAMGLRSHALALHGSLRAVVDAVLSVHRPDRDDDSAACVECSDDTMRSWPCATVNALDVAARLLATAVRVIGTPPDEAQQACDALVRVTAERDDMRDAVLALHRDDGHGECVECGVETDGHGIPWPCPTAQAVGAQAPAPGSPPLHHPAN